MRIEFMRGQAGKGDNKYNPPFFGHYWGYWLPNFRWNGGNPFRGDVLDTTFAWLIFWFSITIWPTSRKDQEDCVSATATESNKQGEIK